MSSSSSDDRTTSDIQIDAEQCRSILADETPGEWRWRDRAFHLDGPGDLEARVGVEFDPSDDAWRIEATVCGRNVRTRTAPRHGLHGVLEEVAGAVRAAVLEALDEMRREVNACRLELLDWNGRDPADDRHSDPFSRWEIIQRLAVCNPNASKYRDIVEVGLSIEAGGFPSGDAGLVVALDLLDSPTELDAATAERIGDRLQAIGADLEERGRELVESRSCEVAG